MLTLTSRTGARLAWLAMAALPLACLALWLGRLPAVPGDGLLMASRVLVEVASMLTCTAVLSVAWSVGGRGLPPSVRSLALACTGSLLLGLCHALSTVSGGSASSPSPLSASGLGIGALAVAERAAMAIGLLFAALAPLTPLLSSTPTPATTPRAQTVKARRALALQAVLILVGAMLGLGLFGWIDTLVTASDALDWFIDNGNYLIATLFGFAAFLHARRLGKAGSVETAPLVCAAAVMAVAEIIRTPLVQSAMASTVYLAWLGGLVLRLVGFVAMYRGASSASMRLPREQMLESHELLHESQEQLRTIADNIPAMVAFIDCNQVYRFVNRNYDRWLGMKPQDMLGQTVRQVYGAEGYARLQSQLERALSGQSFDVDHQLAPVNGSQGRWLNITYMPKVDASGHVAGVYLLSSDITERKLAESQALFLAEHDALTSLPNRVAFQKAVQGALQRSSVDQSRFAVIFIDVDRFKVINDTLGHAAGDRLLRTLAERMKQAVRGQDLVARMGGDEMCVLLHDLQGDSDITEITGRILTAMREPVELRDGVLHHVSVSAGIAIHPQDGADEETLLRHADIAMYRAKSAGRDGFALFGEHDSAPAEARLNLELELRTAIDDGQLVLHYQPRVDVSTGRPLGVEALVRWQHPVRGLLAPLHFIDIAEETGLIVPMGEWVLREAGRALRRLHAGGAVGLSMSVNVSARQFRSPRLVDEVAAMIADTCCAPHQIELELTESAVMDEPDAAQATMRRLKALGVRLAMDDFGTGYSSLAALKRFPVDCVKIDRSFVNDIPADPDDAALTRAIIAMGHSLGLYVVAEGVERREQLDFLRREGCDEYQGYYFAKPMSEEAVARQLREFPRAALVSNGT